MKKSSSLFSVALKSVVLATLCMTSGSTLAMQREAGEASPSRRHIASDLTTPEGLVGELQRREGTTSEDRALLRCLLNKAIETASGNESLSAHAAQLRQIGDINAQTFVKARTQIFDQYQALGTFQTQIAQAAATRFQQYLEEMAAKSASSRPAEGSASAAAHRLHVSLILAPEAPVAKPAIDLEESYETIKGKIRADEENSLRILDGYLTAYYQTLVLPTENRENLEGKLLHLLKLKQKVKWAQAAKEAWVQTRQKLDTTLPYTINHGSLEEAKAALEEFKTRVSNNLRSFPPESKWSDDYRELSSQEKEKKAYLKGCEREISHLEEVVKVREFGGETSRDRYARQAREKEVAHRMWEETRPAREAYEEPFKDILEQTEELTKAIWHVNSFARQRGDTDESFAANQEYFCNEAFKGSAFKLRGETSENLQKAFKQFLEVHVPYGNAIASKYTNLFVPVEEYERRILGQQALRRAEAAELFSFVQAFAEDSETAMKTMQQKVAHHAEHPIDVDGLRPWKDYYKAYVEQTWLWLPSDVQEAHADAYQKFLAALPSAARK